MNLSHTLVLAVMLVNASAAFAQVPPSTTLPEVAVNAPASAAQAPAEDPAAAASPAPVKQFSYGDANVSVLFMPAQVEQMKEAIRAYESVDHSSAPVTFEQVVEEPTRVVEKIEEPSTYPVFFLSSIAYHNDHDWSIWVSGYKITAQKNDTDLNVVKVARDYVIFSWKPSYTAAIAARKHANQFASVEEIKHKLVVNQNIDFEPKSGTVIFMLRQNQSLPVGYFHLFEGFVESPKLAALTVENAPSLPEAVGNSLQRLLPDMGTGMQTNAPSGAKAR